MMKILSKFINKKIELIRKIKFKKFIKIIQIFKILMNKLMKLNI